MNEAQNPNPELVRTRMRPLSHPALEVAGLPAAEALLASMCQMGTPSHPDAVAKRLAFISEKDGPLTVFPDDQRLLATIAEPLRHAKAAFMTGNYTACVALAGSIGETLSELAFEVHGPYEVRGAHMPGKPLTTEGEVQLFGRSFAKLEQKRRIEVLLALGVIAESAAELFEKLRAKRNEYVHPSVQRGGKDATADAVSAYSWAVTLAGDVIGREFRDGAWGLKSAMAEYLRRTGVVKAASVAVDGRPASTR
jgi:hypothetical protein